MKQKEDFYIYELDFDEDEAEEMSRKRHYQDEYVQKKLRQRQASARRRMMRELKERNWK